MTTVFCKKHGTEFEIYEGCAQCIAEKEAEKYLAPGGIIPGPQTVSPDSGTQPSDTGTLPTEMGTALALRAGEDIEVHGYFEEARGLLKFAKERVIVAIGDAKAATDDLSIIAKLKKTMEAKRKEYLSPLKEQVDAINETYKTLMEPVLEADKITRDKVLAYQQEQARIRAEQEEINRKRMEAAEAEMKLKGELSESVNLVEVIPEAKKVSTDMGSTGMVSHWTYEIVDESVIPREYLVVDTAMLTAIAKKHHDSKPVAGVRFYNNPIIAVRAR